MALMTPRRTITDGERLTRTARSVLDHICGLWACRNDPTGRAVPGWRDSGSFPADHDERPACEALVADGLAEWCSSDVLRATPLGVALVARGLAEWRRAHRIVPWRVTYRDGTDEAIYMAPTRSAARALAVSALSEAWGLTWYEALCQIASVRRA